MGLWERIELKTDEQIALMRTAGLLVGETLEKLRVAAVAGVTLLELDALAEDSIRSGGGVPSFLGYGNPGFPASICASVNDEVVHGIPTDRVLVDGDLLSIDCGAIVQGWHGDAAITVAVGNVDPEVVEMSRVCEESLWRGIAAMVEGNRLSDIGHAVEGYVTSQGAYGILEGYTGHGIGTEMHQDPAVLNYGQPGHGPKLKQGACLAIEPMITLGSGDTKVLADEWTVATIDGSAAAHWEHTVALTADGPWVLTALDGGFQRLSDLGLDVPNRAR